jgi:hypothetical protein
MHGQLLEPPLIASFSGQKVASGHRLWVTGHYNVKSEDYPNDVSEGELEDVSSVDGEDDDDDDAHNKIVTKRSASSSSTALEFTIDPESGCGVSTILEHALWQVYGLFHLAVSSCPGLPPPRSQLSNLIGVRLLLDAEQELFTHFIDKDDDIANAICYCKCQRTAGTQTAIIICKKSNRRQHF